MVVLDNKPYKLDIYLGLFCDGYINFISCIPSCYSTKVLQGYHL